ncbi:hypothetical protein Q8F55_000199 [Vanrija albida]|uniref:Uncharacterized protein n=1 Tax=Vanrija albida TaxID=181172 RepID=A0ABR3QCK4_9TREE
MAHWHFWPPINTWQPPPWKACIWEDCEREALLLVSSELFCGPHNDAYFRRWERPRWLKASQDPA